MHFFSVEGRHLVWNTSGVVVAGDGTAGSGPNKLNKPEFIYIGSDDTLYICDHENDRVQRKRRNSSTIDTVTSSSVGISHPEGITFDRNGFMYVTGHDTAKVHRLNPSFTTTTVVAGQGGKGSALNEHKEPLGLAVDSNFNLYVGERINERIMQWAPNAIYGTIVVNPPSGTQLYGLLLSQNSADQVYVSSQEKNAVYLWTFHASSPNLTLTQVNGSQSALSSPRGIKYDSYGNLYVADKGNKRIVMYCVNSTDGRVVLDGKSSSPNLNTPHDIDFDSNLNLYVSDHGENQVVRFNRI